MNPDDITPSETTVKARAEFNALPEEEKAKIMERWALVPEWKKEDLRAEAELDLL